MSIDKIGRSGSPIPANATSAPTAAAPGGAPFQVEAPVTPSAVSATSATGPLARLRSGTIDEAGYLEEHLDQATEHLRGLGDDVVQHVRATLREACDTSPVLSGLIAQATRR
jgi:hypothetical protein